MPYPPKYTREQREKAHDLYWIDRQGKSDRGRYTLAQIEKLTGVKSYYVGRIAHGER